MENGLIFDEDGVTVDPNFVRIGKTSAKVAEITRVHTMSCRTDAHVAPVCWIVAFLISLLWITAPSQNTFHAADLGRDSAVRLVQAAKSEADQAQSSSGDR